jgi:shikimate kinase
MPKRKNIVLIGMPGCGKSTVGLLLAKHLCMRFVDTDMLIQARENMPLQKIINNKGSEYFARLEEEVILSLCAEETVIATGGSAVLHPGAMEHLKKISEVVYLEADFGLIRKRLWNLKTRGIILGPGKTLEDLYRSRKPEYEKYADVTIRIRHKTLEQIVTRIADLLGRSFSSEG